MTIIAGFQCIDGILLCADTEESMGRESKSQVHKIPICHVNDSKLAIGGAGRTSLVEFVSQDLPKYLADKLDPKANVENILNQYARKIFLNHIKPFIAIYDDPTVAFLIGVVHNNVPTLYKWEDNFVYALQPYSHTSIGIGTLQSNQLLNQVQFSYDYEAMLFFAIRVMLRVKQTVQGCGGRTESVFLNEDMIIRPGAIVTAEIEHLVEMADEVTMNHALSLISWTNADSKKNEEELGILKAAVLHFQKQYRQTVHVLERFKSSES